MCLMYLSIDPYPYYRIVVNVFESIVYQHLKCSFNHVLIDKQHGFSSGKAIDTSGVSFLFYMHETVESGHQLYVIITDIRKVFNTVNHSILINELELLGIGHPLLGWIKSYISSRKKYVTLADVASCVIEVPSGAPQGGHLRPLLFPLFINSLSYHH